MGRRFLQSKFVQRIVHINDTPEAIALGAAVGMFIGMTPTVGIQMLLMIVVGTVIRANRLAGVAMVYVSNPFTLIPIYWLDYWVGSSLLGLEKLTYDKFELTCDVFLAELRADGFWAASFNFIAVHSDIAWGLTVGGLVLGVILAIPVYPLTLRLVWAHRRHRAKHKDGSGNVDGSDGEASSEAGIGTAARAKVESKVGAEVEGVDAGIEADVEPQTESTRGGRD